MFYMKHKLSETSRLWLAGDTATLLVQNSIQKRVFGWFSMAAGAISAVGFYFFYSSPFLVSVGCLLFLYGLLSFGYRTFVVIDTKQGIIKRNTRILNFSIHNKLVSWEKKCAFKYVIAFNSLERFAYISLFVYSSTKDSYTFVMRFPEDRAFFAFKKTFNTSFPELQITETAASKVAFEAAEVHRRQIRSSHNRVLRHKDHLL
jgi:hypothetical protein